MQAGARADVRSQGPLNRRGVPDNISHYPLLNKPTTRDIDFAARASRAPVGL